MKAPLSLKDIVLPEPVTFWPPAPGWWLLAGLLLLISATLIFWLVRRSQHQRRIRRQQHQFNTAIAAIERTEQANDWFKRLALQYVAPQQVASLHGDAWFTWLHNTLPENARDAFLPTIELLRNTLYRSTTLDAAQQQLLRDGLNLWWQRVIEPVLRRSA